MRYLLIPFLTIATTAYGQQHDPVQILQNIDDRRWDVIANEQVREVYHSELDKSVLLKTSRHAWLCRARFERSEVSGQVQPLSYSVRDLWRLPEDVASDHSGWTPLQDDVLREFLSSLSTDIRTGEIRLHHALPFALLEAYDESARYVVTAPRLEHITSRQLNLYGTEGSDIFTDLNPQRSYLAPLIDTSSLEEWQPRLLVFSGLSGQTNLSFRASTNELIVSKTGSGEVLRRLDVNLLHLQSNAAIRRLQDHGVFAFYEGANLDDYVSQFSRIHAAN